MSHLRINRKTIPANALFYFTRCTFIIWNLKPLSVFDKNIYINRYNERSYKKNMGVRSQILCAQNGLRKQFCLTSRMYNIVLNWPFWWWTNAHTNYTHTRTGWQKSRFDGPVPHNCKFMWIILVRARDHSLFIYRKTALCCGLYSEQ